MEATRHWLDGLVYKSLNLSESQFPHLWNGAIILTKEKSCEDDLELSRYRAHRKCSLKTNYCYSERYERRER